MLDNRLAAVAAFVPLNVNVADIGTDHGYLAMELFRREAGRRVIAADKNSGPCEAARRSFAESGLDGDIEVRQGDGLAALSAGEVDMVCIAGMGGRLITDILAAQPAVFRMLKGAVLQPQGGADILRRWLYEQGWHVEDESLAKVDGRIYQIILAEVGKEAMPKEMELLLGPVLVERKPQLFKEFVEGHIEACEKILQGIKRSSQPDVEKINFIEKEIEELKKYNYYS